MQDNHFARLVRTETVALKKSSVDFVTSLNVNLKGGNQKSRQIIHFERGPIKRQQAQQRRFPAQTNSSPPRPPTHPPQSNDNSLDACADPHTVFNIYSASRIQRKRDEAAEQQRGLYSATTDYLPVLRCRER